MRRLIAILFGTWKMFSPRKPNRYIPLEGPPLTDLEIDALYQDEALESL